MRILSAIVPLLMVAAAAPAQFTSGSTGADGRLAFPVGDGSPQVIDFDPLSFDPPLDPEGDGVYHFTSITIPANITVRLRADRCGYHPLYWLVSGPVTIAGTLDLSGESPIEIPYGLMTRPTIPGPGGFPGGMAEVSDTALAQPGLGPGGGQFPSAGGSHATAGYLAFGFPPYGNPFLVPLIGGSGGAGSPRNRSLENLVDTSLNGGAGGGAILIASDESIIVTGHILARGGDRPQGREGGGFPQSYLSGGGSGGAIRLVTPNLSGGGEIAAGRDLNIFSSAPGGAGRVRIEAIDDAFTGAIHGEARRVTLLPTTELGLPGSYPTPGLRIVRIGGQAVPQRPGGGFDAADVSLNSADPVLFEIEAKHVPPGTSVSIALFNETTYLKTITADPLSGTLEAGTTTATDTVSQGFTRGFAFATWSNQ